MAVARAIGLLAQRTGAAVEDDDLAIQHATALALTTVPLHAWTGEQRHLLAGYIGVYLWRAYPPEPWRLADVEPPYPGGAADLLWEHPDGRRLLDEIKTDKFQTYEGGNRHATLRQIKRHTEFGLREFGDSYIGLRLLTLSAPRQSLLINPQGQQIPLLTTPWCTEGGW